MNSTEKKEQDFFMTVGFIQGIFGSALFALILYAIYKEISIINFINAGASIAVGASAVIAFSVYRANVKKWIKDNERKISLEYLTEAKNLLERAYNTLTSNGKHTNPPKNDRLNWLTTARFLLSYQKTKQKIENLKNLDHIDIIEEHEEFWRHQFYIILSNGKLGFPSNYYEKENPSFEGDFSNLAPSSLAVIYSFSEWPDGKIDSLTEVDEAELLSQGIILMYHRGLADYISKFHKLQEKLNNIIKRNLTKK